MARPIGVPGMTEGTPFDRAVWSFSIGLVCGLAALAMFLSG